MGRPHYFMRRHFLRGLCITSLRSLHIMQHDLEVWRDALNAFDHCEYEIAIVHFQKLGSLSKAWYNIGVSNIAIGSIDESVATFFEYIHL